jgi:hypothetical protein
MKRIDSDVQVIKIPKNIYYISDWEVFDDVMPNDKQILLDKSVCGCGLTYHYLSNNKPVVLISPRVELLLSKANDKELQENLFYFRTDNASNRLITMKNKLKNYLLSSNLFELPFSDKKKRKPPKIEVSYDSINHILEVLQNLGIEDKFTFVVDECQSLLSDSHLKGSCELNVISKLFNLNSQTIFLTATPLDELFLNYVDYFKGIKRVKLEFDKSVISDVLIKYQPLKKTPSATIVDIIKKYLANGYFESKVIEGKTVYSKEAVFFVNNLKTIRAVAKTLGLTTENTLILCGKNDTNSNKLREIGLKVGHLSTKENYKTENKPFTFSTKASFEGSDFYSDNSSTYVFSDSNIACLNMDIAVDLKQICGRCRTKSNPFRNEVVFYYKTYNGDLDEVEQRIKDRIKHTEKLLANDLKSCDEYMALACRISQKTLHFQKNYVDAVKEETGYKAVFNQLALADDYRTLGILRNQYKGDFEVLQVLDNEGFSTESLRNTELTEAIDRISQAGRFVYQMKYYIELLEEKPQLYKELQAASSIPSNIQQYINELGKDRCRALDYKESNILKELAYKTQMQNIKAELRKEFIKGLRISVKDVKAKIQEVYDKFQLKKKAKSTDLALFDISYKDIRLNKIRAYEIF